MAIVIIINGIPGSGKSQFRRAIASHYKNVYKVVHFNDYPILLDIALSEQSLPVEERRVHLKEEGGKIGIDIRDRSVLLASLELLAAQVREYARERAVVLIEFARTSYANVWECFQSMENALFFFMHTPYDTCKERIQQRVLRGRSSDDQPIPEGAMMRYLEDGFLSWTNACDGARARVLDNSGDWDDTWREVQPYLDEVVYHSIRPGLWSGITLKSKRPAYKSLQWESQI